MIEKMMFLSINGPKSDIDRVVCKYLSKYEIHLENALSELKTVKNLKPYLEMNPYHEWLTKLSRFTDFIAPERLKEPAAWTPSFTEITALIRSLETEVQSLQEQLEAVTKEKEAKEILLHSIKPFFNFDYDIHQVLQFKFIRYRFGRIERDYYEKFEKYAYSDLETVFFKCHRDAHYVWGIYFVPSGEHTKVDAVFTSLHFERIYIPDEYEGTAKEAYNKLAELLSSYEEQIASYKEQINALISAKIDEIVAAKHSLESLSRNFDVRKVAACTTDHSQDFYILCGWLPEREAIAFEQDIANDENVFCIVEDDHDNLLNQPPTRLKNLRLIRPFEMFVKMYGLPSYHEMDPTLFVALTYAFLFGAMFGDVGQGLVLVLGGYLLYHFKKIPLAAIISCAGMFSTIFGFLFGSFFGFEDVIPALWLHPTKHMTTLPFIGRLNTVFVLSIALGMFLILLCMIFQIRNAIKTKDTEYTWFDTNGLAGFLFYAAVVTIVMLFMTGQKLPAGILLVIMFLVPLVLIILKEPLTDFIKQKADFMPKQKGMFLVQSVFEIFEILLSYFSNTLSFVRIGAFAISHAAMMEVVLMLAGVQNGGSPNWIVIILGNVFVCGMEGLIVGIQVLRLEYYELFSRFYKGTGREFKPFTTK